MSDSESIFRDSLQQFDSLLCFSPWIFWQFQALDSRNVWLAIRDSVPLRLVQLARSCRICQWIAHGCNRSDLAVVIHSPCASLPTVARRRSRHLTVATGAVQRSHGHIGKCTHGAGMLLPLWGKAWMAAQESRILSPGAFQELCALRAVRA